MQIKLIEITNSTKRYITYAIHTYAYAYITNNLNRNFFFFSFTNVYALTAISCVYVNEI